VRLARSPLEPDSRGYFLYLDDVLVKRYAGLTAGRAAFRELAAIEDPPVPVAPDPKVAMDVLHEEAMARFFGERSQGERTKGGRTRRR
jgi:hypothetical protein